LAQAATQELKRGVGQELKSAPRYNVESKIEEAPQKH